MYSRQDRDIRVPHNYGGSIFGGRGQPPTPVEDRTRKRPPAPPHTEPEYRNESSDGYGEAVERSTEQICDDCTECTQCHEAHENSSKPLPRSPLADIGTEEILIIALALIVFGNGKEPELALILLALLFY